MSTKNLLFFIHVVTFVLGAQKNRLIEMVLLSTHTGLFPAILGKGPWPKLVKKMIYLTSKLGEINDIEHKRVAKYILKMKLF